MLPSFISGLLPTLLGIVVTLIIGGSLVYAFRGNANRSMHELQAGAIEALKAQNEAQERQIQILEKELLHMKRNEIAMRAAFRQLGVEISEISDTEIILVQANQPAKNTRIIQIPADEKGA